MDKTSLKPDKSTLRFLVRTVKVTRELIAREFGREKAESAHIYFSRSMYFTLGRCWPEKSHIALNLAWVVLNKKSPELIWALIVHEVGHLRDSTHGPEFTKFCEKYGVGQNDLKTAKFLPPAAWLFCPTCGDNQGYQLSTRLDPKDVKARFSGWTCRKCGAEIEYRELSDKGYMKVAVKLRKLRAYGTSTWEYLRAITH